MELVDTHCHIQSAGQAGGEEHTRALWAKVPELTGDSLVGRAREAGVTRLICVGCDLEDSKLAIDFVKNRENCWASIGIHPHEARDALQKGHLDAFAGLVAGDKVVAVGETGLDFYYNHSPKEAQLEVLRFQLELASKHDLPLIFHVREAFDDFWPVFDSFPGLRGVLHSFTDKSEVLEKALQRGLYIGINGIMTFTKSAEQREMYKRIPLQKLLLETDAPFLTPTPYRGTINEPRQVGRVAEFAAELRGETPEELAAATTDNARKLFGV